MQHLFFSCAVAKQLWHVLSKIFGIQLVTSFEDIEKFWLSNKRNGILNVFTSAAAWRRLMLSKIHLEEYGYTPFPGSCDGTKMDDPLSGGEEGSHYTKGEAV